MKKVLLLVLALAVLVGGGKRYLSRYNITLPTRTETEESVRPTEPAEEAFLSTEQAETLEASPEESWEEPAEEPAVSPEPVAEAPKAHTYQVVLADVSWEQARNAAEAAGGYLAVITSQEEFETIAALASGTNALYLWLGAQSNSGQFAWLTGEEFSYTNWFPGEPSGTDSADGTPEYYLCMWKVNGVWSFNDQRNDILSAGVNASGKIGYVIEYEE